MELSPRPVLEFQVEARASATFGRTAARKLRKEMESKSDGRRDDE